MVYETGSGSPPESHTLGQVIEAATRRLDAVPPDDPAARLLREHLDDITAQRDRIAERENAERYTTNVAALVAGCAWVLTGLGGVCLGCITWPRPATPPPAGPGCWERAWFWRCSAV